MAPWERALLEVATSLNDTPGARAIPWLVVGSVASILQSCDMEPRDLDILFTSREDLVRYAAVVAERGSQPIPAILSEHFPGGFEWHKVQHAVDGFPVDAVYIASGGGIPDSTDGEGVWEGGPHAWSLARTATFHGFAVAAAPLEIQLESQFRRGRSDRVEAIISALHRRGYDPDQLSRCLSQRHLAAYSERLKIKQE
jgi:hypothetical protein